MKKVRNVDATAAWSRKAGAMKEGRRKDARETKLVDCEECNDDHLKECKWCDYETS